MIEGSAGAAGAAKTASTPAAAVWGKIATGTGFPGGGILYSNVFPVLAEGESLTIEHLTANLSGELVLVFISKPA